MDLGCCSDKEYKKSRQSKEICLQLPAPAIHRVRVIFKKGQQLFEVIRSEAQVEIPVPRNHAPMLLQNAGVSSCLSR